MKERVFNLRKRGIYPWVPWEDLLEIQDDVERIKSRLLNKEGLGSAYLGWIDYASKVTEVDILRIEEAASRIRRQSDVLLIIGVGGSYLGTRAMLDLFKPYFKKQDLEVVCAGFSFSRRHLRHLMEYLEDKDFSINVISKSGTTTEPAIAFRFFRNLLQKRYGSKANERIYVTTDEKKGALRKQADKYGWTSFNLAEDVGGRYSVITPVGLLPMAAEGIDVRNFLAGVKDAQQYFTNAPFVENQAMQYAGFRYLLYKNHNKKVEILGAFEPSIRFFTEWWKQLFGESEGKSHKGLFPASALYSSDLHSIGQYMQDGERILIETFIRFLNDEQEVIINKEEEDLDELNYLAGWDLEEVNIQAQEATVAAHVSGGVPVFEILLNDFSPYTVGYLVYFFLFSVAISGYLLEVNPFDQEGVEAYKKNMFALLGKPGYEDLAKELKENAKKNNH